MHMSVGFTLADFARSEDVIRGEYMPSVVLIVPQNSARRC